MDISHLRALRRSRGVLLKDAAAVLGTDAGNLSRIELGKQQPSVQLAKRMAAFYGVSLDAIFAGKMANSAPSEAA